MSSQAVFQAAGRKYAPVPPAHEFLKTEARKMKAEGAILHMGKKAAAGVAAGSVGMWVLCGSIGVLCVATMYVCKQQYLVDLENEKRLREIERRRFKELGDFDDESTELLESAIAEGQRIVDSTGSPVCGAYPPPTTASWKMSLSDKPSGLVPLH
eukprot:TRINITY_DN18019_c0_g1_i1.p1 TRINITY_DN18019_c0_g1~~TRINITY_DN18019_c0_g1_i1.p1  ORF type:complete len:177 (+),score=39.30 TRINITY_DN18019_c0_g1_i1:67-531(+)